MISINKCRNTVLYLLEKNNRGFIAPAAFDTFCHLAQMELFEDLFYQYNKWVLNQTNRLTNIEFGDIPKNIQEQIDAFAEYSTDSNFTYNEDDDIWSYTGTDLYRTEGLSLVNAQGKKVDIELVSKGAELNNLINSTINAPTTTYPIYTKIGQGYRIFPTVPSGYDVELYYIRVPKTPKWTYVLSSGNPVYNASASDKQDIELDESMFSKFIIKVMAYCGVSIREQDVVAAASNAEIIKDQKHS